MRDYCSGAYTIGGVGYSSSEEILRDADIAMYRAKSLGKGRYAMFDQAMHAAAIKRLALENDLRRAVQNGEFVVYYQPIVDLDTEKVAGFEALLRWSRPDAGILSPDEFIGIAEETGLIVAIGQWVFREACRQLHAWHQQFRIVKPLTMSINLSARQIDHPALVTQIKEALQETGVDPATVRLEITESATMTNMANTVDILGQLSALGIQFSLDDFGTGYSSLSLLHKLPFDILKIDRSFVTTIDSNPESWNIARTIMNLAQSLDLKVVAEGTERAGQTAALQSLGCDFGQGYLYSRPVDAAAIGQMLAASDMAKIGTSPPHAAA